LEVGGYQELLNMSYWDFLSVFRTLVIQRARQHGKPVAHKGLTTTQEHMIKKQKVMKNGRT
jgi:hypothetical protein